MFFSVVTGVTHVFTFFLHMYIYFVYIILLRPIFSLFVFVLGCFANILRLFKKKNTSLKIKVVHIYRHLKKKMHILLGELHNRAQIKNADTFNFMYN
jgi:hypothetical protein